MIGVLKGAQSSQEVPLKLSILFLFLLLILLSCGKHNQSGKPDLPVIPVASSPYTVNDESIRQDFLSRAQELLRKYDDDLKYMYGPRTVGLIRSRLKLENIQLTEQLLMDERNGYTWSDHRDSQVVLYTGNEEPRLSWRRFREGPQRKDEYSRYVMHELLQLGNIRDHNFAQTDRILFRR